MYKVKEFTTRTNKDKTGCLEELATFLNELGDVAVADIEKEWIEYSSSSYELKVIIVYYDFKEDK